MRAILTALGRLLRVRRLNKGNVEEMERQVLLLREKIRYLQVIAMRPGHSAEDLERLRWLERAARAQLRRTLQSSVREGQAAARDCRPESWHHRSRRPRLPPPSQMFTVTSREACH